jgi:hypothetical protein
MGIYNRKEVQLSAPSKKDGGRITVAQHALPPMLSLQRLNGNRSVHRLIAVGTPGDRWKQAADRAADHVMRSESTGVLPSTEAPGRQHQSVSPDVRVDAAAAANGINHGQPLAPDLCTTMERHFEADFSQVRIHTDPAAERLNAALQARAVTHGSDIYFNQGQYYPWDRPGKHLSLSWGPVMLSIPQPGSISTSPMPGWWATFAL